MNKTLYYSGKYSATAPRKEIRLSHVGLLRYASLLASLKTVAEHLRFRCFVSYSSATRIFTYSVLSLCVFAEFLSCPVASAYNLVEAVERGVTANQQIKAQELMIKEAEQGKMGAYGNFLPTVSFMQQNSKLTNSKDGSALNIDYLSQNRLYRTARLSQPVFTGFYGMNSVTKAKYILEYQEYELLNSKVSLAYDIQRQFIQYLKLQDDEVRIQASVGRLKKQLDAAMAFYERQMAPKLHVIQAEVALARVRQDLVRIKTEQENSRVVLNQLLALDLGQKANYSGSLILMDYTLQKTLAEYLEEAKNRPDIKKANLDIKISKLEKKLILSQNLPKVNIEASYNHSDTEYGTTARPDEDTKYWSTMLTVSLQLFKGGKTIVSSMQQETRTLWHRKKLSDLLSKVEMEVRNNYALLLDARYRIDSATTIKEAATRSYERAESRYRTGLGSSVDVLNAQNDVSRAEADIVQARADYQTTKVALDYVTGRIMD